MVNRLFPWTVALWMVAFPGSVVAQESPQRSEQEDQEETAEQLALESLPSPERREPGGPPGELGRVGQGAPTSGQFSRWGPAQRPAGPRAVHCRLPSRGAGTGPPALRTVSATRMYGSRRRLGFPPRRDHLGTGGPSRRPPSAGCAGQRPAFQAVPALFRGRRYVLRPAARGYAGPKAPTGRTGRRSLPSGAIEPNSFPGYAAPSDRGADRRSAAPDRRHPDGWRTRETCVYTAKGSTPHLHRCTSLPSR